MSDWTGDIFFKTLAGECSPASPCSADSDKLTPEQIKNWRNVLLGMIGPYAMLMPDEDVQKMRDDMHAHFSEPKGPAQKL